ncbi:PAM68 family protein [Romeria aff. gracilis LEGE 07310]|uniref:PAM68 family protein n=1 Tax=Vasconcelosia minhoensis LEGE 07310 TaxID=915328 RepID=A0A8J7A6U7_9CYAN|nr:PAM68 family protein [Romeria gracilis]MBE9077110.1 PAM68 family protein [Romeria aff. gracilis LEGE 07310]
MASESERESLPFEPKRDRKKTPKVPSRPQPAETSSGAKSRTQSRSRQGREGIPAAVSQRMLRRMALFSGLPTALGVVVFLVAYYLLSQEIIEFPKSLVLLATMGCFGLGVVGLSYGVISASWDESPGSLLGLSEFKLNFGRIRESRRANKSS